MNSHPVHFVLWRNTLNHIAVNELIKCDIIQSHYSYFSGLFTAPIEGRYLVAAVLMAQRGERTEAVLSVSSRSIQKLDSASFSPGDDATRCSCSGSASLSLVLPLRRSEQVGLVLTAGKLAVSPDLLSSFSAALLYSGPATR